MRSTHGLISIPFNKPYLSGNELRYIRHAHSLRHLSGDGFYTKKCHEWITEKFRNKQNLLVHSGTAAIEMMAMLAKIEPGDEVIIPDYTFVSSANAFVLRRGVPVFIDIRPDTLNIDENKIERAITNKTKAIVPVHYAGVSCEMDIIMQIAKKHRLLVLEDAAQGFCSTYRQKYLGTIGDLGAISFHETKNIISGEGGALCINRKLFVERAQILREKGTNRTKFFSGKIDKYTWVDIGSSYLPSEIQAAFLFSQLEHADKIFKKRIHIWNRYHVKLKPLELREKIRRPVVPQGISHNGHLYYLLTRSKSERDSLIQFLKQRGILAVTHYVPLHSSPGGHKFGRSVGSMRITDKTADTLVRLPLYFDIKVSEQNLVIQSIFDFYKHL